MNWNEVYSKYKDTELMDEFMWFYQGIANKDIKDIWGYLIVFAETKGIALEKGMIAKKTGVNEYGQNIWQELIHDFEVGGKAEENMLWCADKFFEIG